MLYIKCLLINCGKSFLASALGQQACLLGYKVLYTNTAKLMSHLKMAKADGAHLKELSKIEKQDALILDDFGVQPFDAQSRALPVSYTHLTLPTILRV